MSDIVERLRAGEWGADVEGADEIKRLTQCAATLEQIRQVCADNAAYACNHRIALDFVHQIAIRALKEQKMSDATQTIARLKAALCNDDPTLEFSDTSNPIADVRLLLDEIERLRTSWEIHAKAAFDFEVKCETIHAETIDECEVTISDVFASTSPRDYMMNGSAGILKRMIDALHALKERQT